MKAFPVNFEHLEDPLGPVRERVPFPCLRERRVVRRGLTNSPGQKPTEACAGHKLLPPRLVGVVRATCTDPCQGGHAPQEQCAGVVAG